MEKTARRATSAPGRTQAPKGDGSFLRALPLYEQVRREITELILGGAWPRGARIPGEENLAAEFGVSVGTVRRALADLVAEGLLARRRRLGTIVTNRSPHHSMRFLYHYYRLHRDDGELVRSTARVVSLAGGLASDDERRRLGLSTKQAEVIRVHRVRSVNGRPVMQERIVLPAHRFPDFPAANQLPQLMYVFFEERYGIRLLSARESLRADLADPTDALLLNVSQGCPVLEIDQVSYDTTHAIIEWRVCRTLTDRFRYLNEVR